MDWIKGKLTKMNFQNALCVSVTLFCMMSANSRLPDHMLAEYI